MRRKAVGRRIFSKLKGATKSVVVAKFAVATTVAGELESGLDIAPL